jgi:MSHA biogenesis protein MshM
MHKAMLLAYGEGRWVVEKRHIRMAAADTPAAEYPKRAWWRLGLGRAS